MVEEVSQGIKSSKKETIARRKSQSNLRQNETIHEDVLCRIVFVSLFFCVRLKCVARDFAVFCRFLFDSSESNRIFCVCRKFIDLVIMSNVRACVCLCVALLSRLHAISEQNIFRDSRTIDKILQTNNKTNFDFNKIELK